MNIVVITGAYYPKFSANSKCMGNIIEEIEHEHNVIVISNDSNNKMTIEKHRKHKIIRVSTSRRLKRKKIELKISNSKGLFKIFWKMCLTFNKVIYVIKIILSKYTVDNELVRSYTQALQTIEHKIDVIIPVTNPIESPIAASKYKLENNNETIVVPFLFDRFSTSTTAHWFNFNQRLKLSNNLKLERNIIDNSNKVLTYFSWAEHIKKYFPSLLKKVEYVEHPLLKKIETNDVLFNKNDKKTKIVYTGGLSKKIRSPRYTLELMKEAIKENESISLHMYLKGDCDEIIDRYVKKHSLNQIFNHGTVPTEHANNAIKNGDYLLLIGNSDITQLQSKVYEYMSCGRPIILIYKDENDPVINILERYPYVCMLKEDYQLLDLNKNKLLLFIEKNMDSYIHYDEVEKLYFDSTPKYVAEKIISIVKEIDRKGDYKCLH